MAARASDGVEFEAMRTRIPRLRNPFARALVVPRSIRLDEATRRRGGAWHVARTPAPVQRIEPRRLGSCAVDLRLPSAWPEFGVLELEAGQVFGSHGWVFTDDGAVLPELSWYGTSSERIRVPRRFPAMTELRGSCLSLVSDWSCRNFAHFLLDGLGRLAVFLDAGFSLDDVDHVYCPSPPTATAARLFERFRIPREKRVWATSQAGFRAERLFVPSLPATGLAYPPWLATFLRHVVEVADRRPSGRRLYVSRRGYARQAVSEREVQALLADRGFEIYDASDIGSRAEDFDQAEMVVGAHGAGLANLAFCRPGTRVVEIIPTDNAYPFYFSLAVAAGLDYGYIAARSVEERGSEAFGPSPYDFDLPLHELAAALPASRVSFA
jgi:capsular polysaccharide biosynthesis protein